MARTAAQKPTWLSCAGKLLAFSGPSNVARVYYGFKSFTPDDYCDYFKQRGVTAVVRLNKPVSIHSMHLVIPVYLGCSFGCCVMHVVKTHSFCHARVSMRWLVAVWHAHRVF